MKNDKPQPADGNQPRLTVKQQTDENLPGYPHYPGKEDIYRQEKHEAEIDPETLAQKSNLQKTGDHSMDLPGVDPVDTGVFAQEKEIINEDEENDYFSIGGDNHNDLEEHRDDLDANQKEE